MVFLLHLIDVWRPCNSGIFEGNRFSRLISNTALCYWPGCFGGEIWAGELWAGGIHLCWPSWISQELSIPLIPPWYPSGPALKNGHLAHRPMMRRLLSWNVSFSDISEGWGPGRNYSSSQILAYDILEGSTLSLILFNIYMTRCVRLLDLAALCWWHPAP